VNRESSNSDIVEPVHFFLKSLLILFLFACLAVGQTSIIGGALQGTLSDSTGGRIAGAFVWARDAATQWQRQVSTDAEGAFRISELPADLYEVLVATRVCFLSARWCQRSAGSYCRTGYHSPVG
jgi:hypothetical protein